MNKAIFLTVSLALILQVVYGQSAPGFNKRFTIDSGDATIYRLFVENDTVVAMGSITVDTAVWGKGIVLMKFDSNGNMLKSKLIVDSLIGQLPVELPYGELHATPDGGYIMSINPPVFEYPVILKTNHEFDVEFFKFYKDTLGYNYRSCDFIPINNGYLLFGSLDWNQDADYGFVRKINLDGESVWVKYFGNNSTDDVVLDMKIVNDSTYIMVMGHSFGIVSGGYNTVRTIDNNGNILQQWQLQNGGGETGYLRDIVSIDSAGLLLYGLYPLEVIPPLTVVVQSVLSRVDWDFNVLWSKRYGKKVTASSEIMFYNFQQTIDSNFVAVGRTSTVPDFEGGPTYARGWLMKFSPEGDSIWSRQDTSDMLPWHVLNSNRLGGAGVLSSGTIIAGGYARHLDDYYAWLIKVTNDGCLDTLYCGLVSGVEETPKTNRTVTVFPNPATKFLNVEYSSLQGQSATLYLTNMFGRTLGAFELDPTSMQHQIPLDGLPNGPYFYSILEDGQRVFSGKFIKLE